MNKCNSAFAFNPVAHTSAIETRITIRSSFLKVLLCVFLICFSKIALADTFTIRAFGIVPVATDLFNDGTPPPEGPAGAATYSTSVQGSPTPFGPEVNNPGGPGGLQMTPETQGALSSSPIGQSFRIQQALWLTPLTGTGALLNTTLFDVFGVFDLVQPTLPAEAYGIRLADFAATGTPNLQNDVLQLDLRRNLANQIAVQFRFLDFVNGVDTLLDQYILTPSDLANQFVELEFFHLPNSAVQANYCFLSSLSTCNAISSFSTTGTIFSDEAWTRGAFIAQTPVPEPSAWLLMGVGLLGLVVMRRTILN